MLLHFKSMKSLQTHRRYFDMVQIKQELFNCTSQVIFFNLDPILMFGLKVFYFYFYLSCVSIDNYHSTLFLKVVYKYKCFDIIWLKITLHREHI